MISRPAMKSSWIGATVRDIDTTIYCTHPQHNREPALYKIAAEWIGGDYRELKTYGFANDACLAEVYRQAVTRMARLRPGEGEKVGAMCIFRLRKDCRDSELERLTALETKVSAGFTD